MTGEKIIIDGVDVADCKYGNQMANVICLSYQTLCRKIPNCHYKQLQRAKKEIEHWKHNFKVMKNCFKNVEETATRAIKEKWQLTEDLTALQQTYTACEKEYIALTKRYHELQGLLNPEKSTSNDVDEKGG